MWVERHRRMLLAIFCDIVNCNVIVKTPKQPKCPSAGESMRQSFINAVDYYTADKMNWIY
jgi:hypothetical protein